MRKIIVLIMVVITAFSFTACKKKPIIGYQVEVPQEWVEEAEEQKNNPYTELNRTADLDGIWRNEATGEYYHLYNGHIFIIDRIDAQEGEYDLWGTVVAIQMVEKDSGDENNSENDNQLTEEEKISIYLNANYTEITDGYITIIDSGRTKTVLNNGKEYLFKLIKEVDDWPKGYLLS